MMLQFAHYLAKERTQNGRKSTEVYVRARCGLNGRPKTDLVNPTIVLIFVFFYWNRQILMLHSCESYSRKSDELSL